MNELPDERRLNWMKEILWWLSVAALLVTIVIEAVHAIQHGYY